MNGHSLTRVLVLVMAVQFIGCNSHTKTTQTNEQAKPETVTLAKDLHSFSNPNQVRVTHLSLDVSVDFENKELTGSATWKLNRIDPNAPLVLDVKNMTIKKVTSEGEELKYDIIEGDEVFGNALSINLLKNSETVTIEYATHADAEALQWLSKEQTKGGEAPFMFSQSQAILARTWVPSQDSPGVRFTYDAHVKVPKGLMALMSAENPKTKKDDGSYTFNMTQPISSYLLAIAVGDVQYQKIGRNSGVYAEPDLLDASAWEFAQMQDMIDSAEALYGAYAWEQYDVLVLPPSFPFGGMENPRITFATPTILAGDRSLVSLIAHELAHSWSGNLVTNETWNDFWLNEGFTVYFEQRIMEKVFGKDYADMLTKLGMGDLKKTINELTQEGKEEDTHLYLNLEGRNPDDGLTDVAYEKGRFFLRHIEQTVGREKFDVFLKTYFEENAFKPMNTEKFLNYLQENLLQDNKEWNEKIKANAWVYGPGIPNVCEMPESAELAKIEDLIAQVPNEIVSNEEAKEWTTHHWLYYLRGIEGEVNKDVLAALDMRFDLTHSGNNEILCVWYQHCITEDYEAAYPEVESFLKRVGRRKFLTPIYGKMLSKDNGKDWAARVYEEAKKGYHAVSKNTLESMIYKR
jgi:leukotriene-A4 hydrolase